VGANKRSLKSEFLVVCLVVCLSDVPGGVPEGVPSGINEGIGVDSVNGRSKPQDRLRPKILYREKAEYTHKARDRGIEGKVIL